MNDVISNAILKIINHSNEPLETKAVQEIAEGTVKKITRTKLFYRLNILRGDGLINGKFVGPGKGVWIWWRKEAFSNGGKK